jgi:hypothetical protein
MQKRTKIGIVTDHYKTGKEHLPVIGILKLTLWGIPPATGVRVETLNIPERK